MGRGVYVWGGLMCLHCEGIPLFVAQGVSTKHKKSVCRTTKRLYKHLTWPHYLNAPLSRPGVKKNVVIVEQLRREFQSFSIWKKTHKEHTQLSHPCADAQKHFRLSRHTFCPECFLSSSHPLWLFPTSDHIQETLAVHTGSFVFVGINWTFSLSSRKDMKSVFYSFCRKSSPLALRFILWNPGKGTWEDSGHCHVNPETVFQVTHLKALCFLVE